MKILCVGAGLANAALIHFLKKNISQSFYKLHFDVIDQRDHIGGNCYTYLDNDTGIGVHKYGPHIFNTNSSVAWEFANELLTIHPFTNRVKAHTQKGIFSMPINLHTINQLYKTSMNVAEATQFMANITEQYKQTEPNNFEEAMLSHLGRDLYLEFIYGYTKKQWGVEPKQLPAAIAKRLPFRLSYNDNYYNKKYQGLPQEGYTLLFEKIFDEQNICVHLSTPYQHELSKEYDLILYTGTIDQFFDYEFGRLSYRTVYWEKRVSKGPFQGNAVINYTDMDTPYTRINEPCYFEPWKEESNINQSIYFVEFSKATGKHDEPYYPIRLEKDMKCLTSYQDKANSKQFSKFIFHGRLGAYRYLDMDIVIEQSHELAHQLSRKILKS
jgi:UDP-galactopyranose mutase